MFKLLNLLDELLAKARRLQESGRSQDALPILRRLCKCPDLSAARTLEVHQLLGETHLELSQFKFARKHLRAALRLEPHNASTHHLLALAIQSDPEFDSSRAAAHHRRALELAPSEPDFLTPAGAYFVEMGRVRKGLEMLRRAVELLPDDFDTFQALIESLCEASRFDEARKTLNGARFRFCGHARFASLHTEVELREIRQRQHAARTDAPATEHAEPVILPFNRAVAKGPKPVRAYRRDAARSYIGRPHLLRRFDAEAQ
jgi:pentatricopeptide repeat protein